MYSRAAEFIAHAEDSRATHQKKSSKKMAVKRKNNTLPLDAPPGAVDAYANARILEKRSLSTDGEVRAELKMGF